MDSDLLVVPSLWPEPFGRIGPEAGTHGLPVAGFAVGGIPDWLEDGVNGYLARGDPPGVAALSDAIVKCLRDDSVHQKLRQGAVSLAARYSMRNHINALFAVFEAVLQHPETQVC
jgi:glycosyltransferase involved in cell wall biosynthesis